MTTENELEQIKEALEEIAEYPNGGSNIRIAETGLKALNKYTERLKSEELMEQVAGVIFDKIAFCGFSDRESRIVAQAAIKTIIGDK